MNTKIVSRSAPLLALAALVTSSLALGQDVYSHGNGALQIFDAEGQANSPRWVMVWVALMAASFAAGLFFLKNHVIARWVIGGFVSGVIVMLILEHVFNVTILSGLIAAIHIVFWTPALYQLLSKRPFLAEQSAFSIWSGVITFVILFSFVFDIRDAFIYLTHIL